MMTLVAVLALGLDLDLHATSDMTEVRHCVGDAI